MEPVVLFVVWISVGFPAAQTPAPAEPRNLVRFCSVAEASSGPCQELDARLLALSPVVPAGQLAFIDPATLQLVQPTEEQLKELAFIVEESMAPRHFTVETLPDRTLMLHSDSGFLVFQKAVVQSEGKKR